MGDKWFEIATLDHFWIQRRFEVMVRLSGDLVHRAATEADVAEIGCGNGLLQRQLEDTYGFPVAGFDLNEQALQQNISQRSPLYCYDIHQRAPDFHEHFSLIFLFDVIEHVTDEDSFLSSVIYHLAKTGSILLNVPADQSLYSNYDKAVGHVRRYSIEDLQATAKRNQLRVTSFTYWGRPLRPLLFVRKAWNPGKTKDEVISAGMGSRGRLANGALGMLARCERIPQRRRGSSLMAVLEREQ